LRFSARNEISMNGSKQLLDDDIRLKRLGCKQ
jgi:hypothetical protein